MHVPFKPILGYTSGVFVYMYVCVYVAMPLMLKTVQIINCLLVKGFSCTCSLKTPCFEPSGWQS